MPGRRRSTRSASETFAKERMVPGGRILMGREAGGNPTSLARGRTMSAMPLDLFLPFVRRWFEETFGAPTRPQREGWAAIAAGRHTLIVAPTGSGKTLAAFLWTLDHLHRLGLEGRLEDRVYVVYVSPLRALNNDVEKNLRQPLAFLILPVDQGNGCWKWRDAFQSAGLPVSISASA